ncbi:MAG: 3'-5' exonuclease [Armatimonadetes bacterium]|nr:3'-5' exonuclease [Armatimonadota bacterium]
MATLVVDIETVGVDAATLDAESQRYLLRAAEREPTEEAREAARARIRGEFSLWPMTGRIVTIAMLNVDSGRGRVLYESDLEETWDEDGTTYVGTDEVSALHEFWRLLAHYARVVTFNGRGFDGPYLMLRSALLGIRPSRDLVGKRYDEAHVDLLERLTCFGATRKFSLDFYCRAFGIPSPKGPSPKESGEEGVSGADVARLHGEGRRRDIARYCRRDVGATALLYRRWQETLGEGMDFQRG